MTPTQYAIIQNKIMLAKSIYTGVQVKERIEVECTISYEKVDELIADSKIYRDIANRVFLRSSIETAISGQTRRNPASRERLTSYELDVIPSRFTEIDYAVFCDRAEMLAYFLESPECQKEAFRLLNLALYLGRIESTKILIKYVDIKAMGSVPAIHAVFRGNIDGLLCLKDNEFDLIGISPDGNIALYEAIERNYVGCIELLLSEKALQILDIDQIIDLLNFLRWGFNFKTLDMILRSIVQIRTSKADFEVLNQRLEEFLNIDSRDKDGYTLLIGAVLEGEIEYLKVLLEVGADVVIQNTLGMTAMHYAVYEKQHECLEILVKHGRGLNKIDHHGLTCMMASVAMKDLRAVEILKQAGANVGFKGFNGRTAVHTAVAHESYDCLQELVKGGIGIDVEDEDGNTPLFDSISVKDECSFRILFWASSLTIKNRHGVTLLMHACKKESSFVEYMILDDAIAEAIDIQDDRGMTALMYAVIFHEDAVESLLAANAQVNIRDNRGRTALMHAVMDGVGLPVIELLLEHGADKALKDVDGLNIYDLMRRRYRISEDFEYHSGLAKLLDCKLEAEQRPQVVIKEGTALLL